MQISTIKNPNFEKPFRNPSNRTQVNVLKKKFFGYLSKKIWFRVCSVTAKMFELRNSGENRRKRSEIFFENLPREYKDLILVKKKFKIISCLCTFKEPWIDSEESISPGWESISGLLKRFTNTGSVSLSHEGNMSVLLRI